MQTTTMLKIEIRHRFKDTVLFAATSAANDQTPIRSALAAAIAGGAYLRGADLRGADLGGAYLRGADLGGADLRGAYLRGADLGGAYLRGADLGGADLRGAYLRGAYLGGADLRDADLGGAYLGGAYLRGAYLGGADLRDADLGGAYLRGAYLGGADLRGAYLGGADLRDADLGGADLRGADLGGADLRGAYLANANNLPLGIEAKDPPTPYVRRIGPEGRAERARHYREAHPKVPVVDQLDAKILARVEANPLCFDMGTVHNTCKTTHCRAGHAVDLAGTAGYALEAELGWEAAGRAIYIASTGRAPWFYASDENALADIRRCAAEQLAQSAPAEVDP